MTEHPQKIGPYRIESWLGAGGMGEVYRAYDDRLGRRVALKQILTRNAADPEARGRFLREARSAAKLSHPAVVQVHDILEAEGCDWIVMELAEGQTLKTLLTDGPFPVRRALPLAAEIAAGLAAAHGQGIVHRDLKTENVMVTPEEHAKILDFGLAKPFLHGEEDAYVTADGVIIGTPRSMSPEHAMGRQVDHRSDLFSLGILLYEMLTGTSPFAAESKIKTLKKISRDRQIPVCELVPEIPRPLSDLVERLLEKDPEHRPQSADEVALALEPVTRSLPDGTRAPSPPRPARPPAALEPGESETIDARGLRRKAGERRQITVMSCKLIEVSSSSLDPEVLYEVTPRFQALAREVVARFDGYLANALERRLLVYFGYPQAHEDDARQAVDAALELVLQVERLADRRRREGQTVLALRAAVHTGPAVVFPGAQQELILGGTYDLVSGLEAAAGPNRVVVSDATHRLSAGIFDSEPLPSVELPGFSRPVAAHRVLAAREPRRAVRGRLAEIHGRFTEGLGTPTSRRPRRSWPSWHEG